MMTRRRSWDEHGIMDRALACGDCVQQVMSVIRQSAASSRGFERYLVKCKPGSCTYYMDTQTGDILDKYDVSRPMYLVDVASSYRNHLSWFSKAFFDPVARTSMADTSSAGADSMSGVVPVSQYNFYDWAIRYGVLRRISDTAPRDVRHCHVYPLSTEHRLVLPVSRYSVVCSTWPVRTSVAPLPLTSYMSH